MKKIFLTLLLLALFFGFKSVYAADLNIYCNDSGCSPANSSSIFSPDLWFPLKTETKTIFLQNNSPDAQLIAISVTNGTTGEEDLSKVMKMKIIDDNFNNLYEDTLENFYLLTEYPLTYLLNGHNTTYSFTVSMNDVDNNWQEKNTAFDMTLGFSYIPIETTPTPTPTPKQENGPTQTPGPNATSTPGPNPTSTPTPEAGTFVTYNYEGQNINVPVLGVETDKTPSPKKTTKIIKEIKEKILGSNLCLNPWWWWVLFILQLALQVLNKKKASPKIKKRILFAQIVSGFLFAFIFFKFFCHWIFTLISILITVFFLILTVHKTQQKSSSSNETM